MFGLLLTFAILLYLLYQHYFVKTKGYPKGPPPLPLLGNLISFGKNRQRLVQLVAEWGKQYDGFFTVWLPQPMIMVTDYELMKSMFVKQGDNYVGRPHMYLLDHVDKGKLGIVFADGAPWKEHRRFALQVLRDFGFGKNIMQERIMVEARKLLDDLQGNIGQKFDPSDAIELCVGNIINEMMFGYSFGKGDEKFVQLRHLLDEIVELFSNPQVMLLENFTWLRYFGFILPKIDEIKVANKKLVDFFASEVTDHKENFDPNSEPTDYAAAFLLEQHRRTKKDNSVGSFTERQLVFALGDIWSAGMETTVTTLRWAIAFLLNHPEIQRKVHLEIAEKLGFEAEIGMEHRNLLPYTAAVIAETQRLANLLPINLMHTFVQDTVVRGVAVRAGTVVLPQISAVLHDERYFPQPEQFKPERFLGENGALSIPEQFIPFSLGKRVCLGESLAKMELFLIFTTIMQRFEFKSDGQPPTLIPQAGFVNSPEHYECFVTSRVDS